MYDALSCPICGEMFGDITEFEDHVDECSFDEEQDLMFWKRRSKNVRRAFTQTRKERLHGEI